MQQICEAVAIFNQGGIIFYPTESIYGLGCDPFNEYACNRVLQIKNRHNKSGLICLISDLKHLKNLVSPLRTYEYLQIKNSVNDHVSWVLPAHKNLPKWLQSKDSTVCIRYSRNPAIVKFCDAIDSPIISTSANLQGQKPVLNVDEAKIIFNKQIDYYLDTPLGDKQQASKIRTLGGEFLR